MGGGGFDHRALVYDRDEDFLAGTVPFVLEGLADDGAVLVALGPHQRSILSAGVGPDADRITFLPMRELGLNPARILPVWADFVDREPTARPLRGIGEPVWPGRTAQEILECQLHEDLLDLAFTGGRPWSLLCPYDGAGLPAEVIRRAVDGHDGHGTDPGFLDVPLPDPPDRHLAWEVASGDGVLRRDVADAARTCGFGERRMTDLVLATQELVTNSIRHGGGRAAVRLWGDPDGVTVEVTDRGTMVDSLVGRHRPAAAQIGGRGLWIANQVCDLVQIRSRPGATTVRVHLRSR